jgi:hypothetical protein
MPRKTKRQRAGLMNASVRDYHIVENQQIDNVEDDFDINTNEIHQTRNQFL